MDLKRWNLHIPTWAPISVVNDPVTKTNCLELRDEEPYDYALAERVFPESKIVEVSFRFNAKDVPQGYALEIEVVDKHGSRPMLIRIDNEYLAVDRKKVDLHPVPIKMDRWYNVKLQLNCDSQSYDLFVDGKLAIDDIPFADQVSSLERIVFRTGQYRGHVSREFADDGVPKATGLDSEDLPGADEKAPLCRYWIDNFETKIPNIK